MCDRYITPSQAEIARYWQLTDARVRNPLGQPLTAAPGAVAPLLRLDANGNLEQVSARWGLIPLWWKHEKLPQDTFIAPSEEATTRPIWSIPARNARCLVPAMGWYEWKEIKRVDPSTGATTKANQAYLTRRSDRQPMAFAGLMSQRMVEGGQPGFTCAILTRDAVGRAGQLLARMPIALPKDAEAAWLYRELTDAAVAIEFAREQALTEFFQHPVALPVDHAIDEVAEPLAPVEKPARQRAAPSGRTASAQPVLFPFQGFSAR